MTERPSPPPPATPEWTPVNRPLGSARDCRNEEISESVESKIAGHDASVPKTMEDDVKGDPDNQAENVGVEDTKAPDVPAEDNKAEDLDAGDMAVRAVEAEGIKAEDVQAEDNIAEDIREEPLSDTETLTAQEGSSPATTPSPSGFVLSGNATDSTGVSDETILSGPLDQITGVRLLQVASTRSNTGLLELINAYDHAGEVLPYNTLANRLSRALGYHAAQTRESREEVKKRFKEMRARNGATKRKAVTRTEHPRKRIKREDVPDNDETAETITEGGDETELEEAVAAEEGGDAIAMAEPVKRQTAYGL